MSISTVGTTAGLLQALNTAQAGDTIYVAAGNYSGVSISGVQFASAVSIVAADPANPAIFTDLNVQGAKGLNFIGIEFATLGPANAAPFKVAASDDIHFANVKVHGSQNSDPSDDPNGLSIGSSKNISVTGSEFHQLKNGLDIGGNVDVVVEGNYFHDIRIDGIVSTGASRVVINANYFTEFHHLAGDHSDAIQFFTKNRNASVHDITITNNVIAQGSGAVMQGIFMSDEQGTLPYLNVKISGNIILGGNWNGIYLNNAQNAEISNNYLVGLVGSPSTPRIVWNDKVSGSVVDNTSTSYSAGKVAIQSNNNKVASIENLGADTLKTWLHNNPVFLLRIPENVLDLIDGSHVAPSAFAPPVAAAVAAVEIVHTEILGSAASDQLSGGIGNSDIRAGVGDDTIMGVSGSNYLRGEEGNDRIVGGMDFDDINGNTGNDTAYGGGGGDWVVGGKDDDVLAGEIGNDIVYGNLGSDTVDGGAGDDIVRGGQDNDWLDGGAGADWLSGDRGGDTIVGGAGADVFHTFADAGMDRVMDFSLAQGDRVMVDPGTQYAVAQTGADVTISMVGGGQMVLVGVQLSTLTGDWIFGA